MSAIIRSRTTRSRTAQRTPARGAFAHRADETASQRAPLGGYGRRLVAQGDPARQSHLGDLTATPEARGFGAG